MTTLKRSNGKTPMDPAYKGPSVREFDEAKDGFSFVANGKAWLVMADYDLAKLPEGRDTIVSAIISAVANGMGADLKEGYHFYTHDMHGVSYDICRLSDGCMAEKDVTIDEAGTRILQTLVKTKDDAGLRKFFGLDWEHLTCWFCGRKGHIMRQCTVPQDKRLPKEQMLAIVRGEAFVSDDGEFVLRVYPPTK